MPGGKRIDDYDIEFFISAKPRYDASMGTKAKKGSAFIADGVIIERSGEKSDR